MTSRDFCYWLQGALELTGASSLDEKQVEILKNHLNLVFVHEIDPSMGDADHQSTLNSIHSGLKTLDLTETKDVLFRC